MKPPNQALHRDRGRILFLRDTTPLQRPRRVKTRFGAQAVKLRVSILEKDEKSCTLDIQAFADDIWGGGARKGTDKLLKALDDPTYKPGCLGVILFFALAGGTSIYWLFT